VQAEKLSRAQIRELHAHLTEAPLENYELLWVLESCLETPASAVYGLGSFPWPAGLMAVHRQCIWLSLENEMLLEMLLAQLQEQDIYRFYTTSPPTLNMLQRWFPGGILAQSSLCARNITKNWKKRFEVFVRSAPDPDTLEGWDYEILGSNGNLAGVCSSQQVVPPWQEIIKWAPVKEEDYWTEQAWGAVTAFLLAEGNPVVVRVDSEALFAVLEPLGYREFSKLYYYVAARE